MPLKELLKCWVAAAGFCCVRRTQHKEPERVSGTTEWGWFATGAKIGSQGIGIPGIL
jgi:hypothetical protein